MSHLQAIRHIVVPQAVTKVPAPMLNELISLLKDTTLVSVVAFGEAALIAREIQAETFNASAYVLAGAMFLVITLPMARLVDRMIKRLALDLGVLARQIRSRADTVAAVGGVSAGASARASRFGS